MQGSSVTACVVLFWFSHAAPSVISLLVECLFILYFSLIGLLKERMQLSCLLGANYD